MRTDAALSLDSRVRQPDATIPDLIASTKVYATLSAAGILLGAACLGSLARDHLRRER